MRLVSLGYILILCTGLLGYSEHPSYVVCRGEAYCTPPLNHDEAMQAAQLKKAWPTKRYTFALVGSG
jgi:hypothetical protein